jgi:hypothetical protein
MSRRSGAIFRTLEPEPPSNKEVLGQSTKDENLSVLATVGF